MCADGVAGRLAELLADRPTLHLGADGAPVSFAVSDRVLHFIDQHLTPGTTTAETGAGLSTIVFAMHGAHHTAITNKQDETERIEAYCAPRGIDLSDVTFIVGDSADVFPNAGLSGLQMVLIDGRHAFPSPFLDWYYLSRAMVVGGLLIVDDTQLWTARALRDFLLEQPGWQHEAELSPQSSCFRLTARIDHLAEWTSQPYVFRQSSRQARASRPSRHRSRR
ncbi:MAG: class I SAM-dependent methyltransferase [Chloroflexi bacterium]|nr:MAG: class I SAM-dependent methyltransferase [Chloroflexota bacterium]